jgi:hypothetical protein
VTVIDFLPCIVSRIGHFFAIRSNNHGKFTDARLVPASGASVLLSIRRE